MKLDALLAVRLLVFVIVVLIAYFFSRQQAEKIGIGKTREVKNNKKFSEEW